MIDDTEFNYMLNLYYWKGNCLNKCNIRNSFKALTRMLNDEEIKKFRRTASEIFVKLFK